VAPETDSAADQIAGQREYAKYIEAQLVREDERKKSFESRGVTVITSSSTLATLLLGLIAIATRSSQTFTLPSDAEEPLALALIAFTFAALLALFTNIPWSVDEADPDGLARVMDSDAWIEGEGEAIRSVAANRLAVLRGASSANTKKGWALVAAMLFEAIAVAFLAWAMLEIVLA
jgi:hypothetical protein